MPTVTISNAGGNWTANATWVGGVPPTSADDVVATATSGNVVINSGSCVCKSVDFTNYVGTLSGTGTLTVSGNVTLVAGMTITATAILLINAASTMTSNGKTWTGAFSVSATPFTITLNDNWTVNGNFTHSVTAAALTLNGNTLTLKGNWSSSAGRTVSGTTNIIFGGTSGTQTIANTAGTSNNVTINSSAAMIWSNWTQSGGTLTYTASGSLTPGPLVTAGTVSLSLASISFTNVTIGAGTITMLANLTLTGTFNSQAVATINGAFTITAAIVQLGSTQTLGAGLAIVSTGNCVALSTATIVNGASATVTVGGSLIMNSSTVVLSGTCPFKMNGTGNITCAGGTSAIRVNLELNTSGTITLSTTNPVVYTTNTFLITAVGSFVTTGSTLSFAGTLTVNTGSITFGTITVTAAATFNGSNGFSVGTFNCTTAGTAFNFKSGNTYTITTGLTLTGTLASRITITASTGASQYILTLSQGATQSVGHVNVTDADSSAGQTIWCWDLVSSNTLNWNSLTASAMQRSYSAAA